MMVSGVEPLATYQTPNPVLRQLLATLLYHLPVFGPFDLLLWFCIYSHDSQRSRCFIPTTVVTRNTFAFNIYLLGLFLVSYIVLFPFCKLLLVNLLIVNIYVKSPKT